MSVGCWSTDFVTDSRTGTDGRCANGSRFGLGGLVPAAGSGFRGACLWGNQRALSRTHGRERMDGAQMGVRFGVGALVHAAGAGFRRACPWGGQRTLSRTHGRERMDGVQVGVVSTGSTQRLRGGWGCPCGGLWVSAGVSVGWSTDSVTDSRTGTDGRRANGSRFGVGGLSLWRMLGFGGRVCVCGVGQCAGAMLYNCRYQEGVNHVGANGSQI